MNYSHNYSNTYTVIKLQSQSQLRSQLVTVAFTDILSVADIITVTNTLRHQQNPQKKLFK